MVHSCVNVGGVDDIITPPPFFFFLPNVFFFPPPLSFFFFLSKRSASYIEIISFTPKSSTVIVSVESRKK